VSTILKALKRLETEQDFSQTGGSVKASFFSAQNTLHRKTVSARFRRRLVTSTIIGLALVAGIIIVIYSLPSKDGKTIRQSIETHPDARRPARPVATGSSSIKTTIPAAKPDGDVPAVQNSLHGRTARKSPALMARDPLGSVQSPEQHGARTSPPNKNSRPKLDAAPITASGEQTAPTAAQQLGAFPHTTISEETSTAEDKPERPSYADAQRLSDGRLKVQAIAWAPEPKDRMAVVNNHIVREGGALEGFSVVAIGKVVRETIVLLL
jgi:hypothetical protein